MPKTKEFLNSEDDLSSNDEAPKKKATAAKAKKRKAEEEEEEENVEVEDNNKEVDDDSPEDTKKKPAAKATNKSKVAKKSSDNNASNDGLYQLDNNRFISVSEFKGKSLINIREYYESNGQKLPGKKGISLSVDQWEKLKSFVGKIDNDLKKK